ncbi:MAG: thiamine-phosphate kinase [Methylococcaceae bacterium]|nr:thiamine-phosphate kinase [Methylococcaceae bacterium]
MAVSEFGLIERYFKQQTVNNPTTRLGIGDDCALLSIPAGVELALTTDTMVENIHFLANANPEWLGHKLLAVNLSDLASMGAKPLSVLLALTLPSVDEQWLSRFAQGFLNLARRYNVDLIGGDTTAGALTLTVQALGLVPANTAMKRSTAQIGDLVCMTGLLGEAGLGLKIAQGHYTCADGEAALARLHRPEPQIAAGLALREFASACIDISDGLAADLGHIAAQSGVGACLEWACLPLSPQVKHYIATTGDWQMPLGAGDDYELCFTISPAKLKSLAIPYTQIGIIDQGDGVRITQSGSTQPLSRQGYEHFSQ